MIRRILIALAFLTFHSTAMAEDDCREEYIKTTDPDPSITGEAGELWEWVTHCYLVFDYSITDIGLSQRTASNIYSDLIGGLRRDGERDLLRQTGLSGKENTFGQATANCEASAGNPIKFGTGQKIEVHTDFMGRGVNPLRVTRSFDSFTSGNMGFGPGWSTSLTKNLVEESYPTVKKVKLGNGKQYSLTHKGNFVLSNGLNKAVFSNKNCTNSNDVSTCGTMYGFYNEGSQFVLVTGGSQQDTFDSLGRVIRTTYSTKLDEAILGSSGSVIGHVAYGPSKRYSYDNNNNEVSSIQHSSGRTLSINWNNGKISSILDNANNQTSYAYDSSGRLKTVTYPNGDTTKYFYEDATNTHFLTGVSLNNVRYSWFEYDSLGKAVVSRHANDIYRYDFEYLDPAPGQTQRVSVVTNPLGLKTRYYYSDVTIADVSHKQHQITTTDQTALCSATSKETFYDNEGRLSSKEDFNGNETKYYYDSNNRLERRVTAEGLVNQLEVVLDREAGYERLASRTRNGVVTRYEYHDYGHITKISIESDGVTRDITFAYEFHPNNLVKKITTTRAHTYGADRVSTTEYDLQGNLTKTTNELGHITEYSEYDSLGRVGRVDFPDNTGLKVVYDTRGRISKIEKLSSDSQITSINYTHNRFGRIATEVHNSGLNLTYIYDDGGRLIETKHTKGTRVDRIVFELNKLGNITKRSIFQNGIQKYTSEKTIDEKGQLLADKNHLNGDRFSFTYDDNGNLKQSKGGLEGWTYYSYNTRNQVTAISEAGKPWENNLLRYNADGLESIQDSENSYSERTIYTRNSLGYSTLRESEASGDASTEYNSNTGEISKTTDGNGIALSYSYDRLGRLTFRGAGSSGFYRYWYYDNGTNAKGKLTKMLAFGTGTGNVVGATEYDYDRWGNLSSQSAIIDGTTYVVDWDYGSGSAKERLNSLIYPGGNKVNYSYDAYGDISKITVTINGVTKDVIKNITRLPFGPVSQFTFGNNKTRTKNYDQSYRLESIYTSGVQDLSYEYNGINISKITDGNSSGFTRDFSYDSASRLTHITTTAGTESYTYDSAGNRLTYQPTSGNKITYNYGNGTKSGNKLKSTTNGTSGTFGVTNYLYDNVGNITAVGHGSYGFEYFTYDGENRKADGAHYNSLGHRVYHNGTHFIHDPSGRLLAEGNDKQYIFFAGELVAYIKNDILYFVHNDHLGRPEVITDTNGYLKWKAEMKPFDRRVLFSGIGDFNIGFPGQYHDGDGIWYNLNRYYDSNTGRYTRSDPIGLEGGFNTYAYALNNPVNLVDPNGLQVSGVYNKTTGILTIKNLDNGKSLTASTFSGTPGLYSPAPNGTYFLSDFPWGSSAKINYFALVYDDIRLDDYADGHKSNYDPSQTMYGIRLHSGLASHACVTVPSDSEWLPIQQMILGTSQGAPITIGGQQYPNYGTVRVTGSGFGSVPN
jgi:RHS repeat-associated protein